MEADFGIKDHSLFFLATLGNNSATAFEVCPLPDPDQDPFSPRLSETLPDPPPNVVKDGIQRL